jgi:serine/threonine protein kinase
VHRDIKPDNLFVIDLEGEPFVKILDFGIAKFDQGSEVNATSTGSMLGTPYYMGFKSVRMPPPPSVDARLKQQPPPARTTGLRDAETMKVEANPMPNIPDEDPGF